MKQKFKICGLNECFLIRFSIKSSKGKLTTFGLLSCFLSLLKKIHEIMHDMCKLQVNVPIDQLHDIVCC